MHGTLEKEIWDHARRLLVEKQVDLVIGYAKGDDPLRNTPVFIRNPDDVEKLVLTPFGGNNLASYITGRPGRIACVLRACEVRSLIVLINERQVDRDRIKIISFGCRGVTDKATLERQVGFEPDTVKVTNDEITLISAGSEETTIPLSGLLRRNCLACRHRNPPITDIMIGEQVEQDSTCGEFGDIVKFEKLALAERREIIKKELSMCIRCYACRNACPLCYCKECQSEHRFPAWFGKSAALSDTFCFHLMRAIHTAGRCVDCGACAGACPHNIDLRKLTGKVAADVKKMFGAESGLKLGEQPVMASYSETDSQDFIK